VRAIVRALDITFAMIGLVLTIPALIIISIAIMLDSKGPPIFKQRRVGQYERLFFCYKLRTMKDGSPSVGTHEISGLQVTKFGRVLRHFKIDELPQLLNVVRGEMSLVGPRPCLPSQVEVIAARRAERIFSVRPGITGAAQLAGIDMSTPVMLALKDRSHLRISVKDYFEAIIATVLGGGRGDRLKLEPPR